MLRHAITALWTATLAFVGLSSYMVATHDTPPTPQPSAAVAEDPGSEAAVALTVRSATVRIDVPGGAVGSGFCRILSDGSVWVWTDAHVILDCRQPKPTAYLPVKVSQVTVVKGEQASRGEWLADIVVMDEKSDLALLRLRQKNVSSLTSLDWAEDVPGIGDRIVVCGCPHGRDRMCNFGHVSNVGQVMFGHTTDMVDAGSQPGSSGGPVVALTGKQKQRALGLIEGGSGETVTAIITSRYARKWAVEHGVLFAFEGSDPPPDGWSTQVEP